MTAADACTRIAELLQAQNAVDARAHHRRKWAARIRGWSTAQRVPHAHTTAAAAHVWQRARTAVARTLPALEAAAAAAESVDAPDVKQACTVCGARVHTQIWRGTAGDNQTVCATCGTVQNDAVAVAPVPRTMCVPPRARGWFAALDRAQGGGYVPTRTRTEAAAVQAASALVMATMFAHCAQQWTHLVPHRPAWLQAVRACTRALDVHALAFCAATQHTLHACPHAARVLAFACGTSVEDALDVVADTGGSQHVRRVLAALSAPRAWSRLHWLAATVSGWTAATFTSADVATATAAFVAQPAPARKCSYTWLLRRALCGSSARAPPSVARWLVQVPRIGNNNGTEDDTMHLNVVDAWVAAGVTITALAARAHCAT